MASKRSYPRTQNFLILIQIAGDSIAVLGGLILGHWVRFDTFFRHIGVESGQTQLIDYLPLILIGTVFFIASFAYLKIYDTRLLLRPYHAFSLFAKGTFFWFCLFLGISLALKFEPAISRLFVTLSCITTLLCVVGWRLGFNAWLARSSLRGRIVQRVVIVGWSHDAERLVEAINTDSHQPYEIIGYISTHDKPDEDVRRPCLSLGALSSLEETIEERLVDIIIVADFDLNTGQLLHIATLCERLYVQFKIMPSFFRIFVSSLHLQTISGVPVLGVEDLKIGAVSSAALKRFTDICGAVVGLLLAGPIMMILMVIIKRESPGPVIYRQTRTGRHGNTFTIYKLRSMRLDAEQTGAQWAVAGDTRRLKIGAMMREWNLDELPQFWNVLIGDMSLVGPRPERPELIEKFEREIPHYNPRHEVRPGITGWAQVNGLRGNTSLVDRIKYDLYYIENWSLLFDFQIMLLTFTKQKNAY